MPHLELRAWDILFRQELVCVEIRYKKYRNMYMCVDGSEHALVHAYVVAANRLHEHN